jgi:chaperonin GroES
VIQRVEEEAKTKGGIIIPDTAKEKPQEGKVVALGTGKIDDNGKKIDFTVKKGDKVLISKYGGTEIKIDNDTYLIMREDDILGIIG